MVDISIVWQKIKLVFSFLKFPSWIAQKIAFWIKVYKFKKLPKDKQEFLFSIYTTKHRTDVAFFNNNEIIIRCLQIDGFIEYEYCEGEMVEYKLEQWCRDEGQYGYTITAKYYKIIEYLWRKIQKNYFNKQKLDYKREEDIPF